MISLIMKNKKQDFEMSYNFISVDDLKSYIKQIKTYQFYNTEIKIKYTHEVEEFMKKTYVSEFFTIDGDYIYLNVVRNGIRRTLKYKRSSNNNKLFKKTLKKIKEQLQKDLSSIDFSFELSEGTYSKDKQIVTIKLIDLSPSTDDIKQNASNGLCVIEFDKDSWTFSFNKLHVNRLESVYRVIFFAFENATKYTRAYRKKHAVTTN